MRQSRIGKNLVRGLALFAWVPLLYFSMDTFAAEASVSDAPVSRVTNAVPGMRIRQGFRVELVASDSAVSAPTALAFDENGRLFVAEMRDYPERREQSPHLGRIRLLEDTDGDGVFDSSTVFADNIALPSAVACFGGGVFVAATPDIFYFKDINGDGVADESRIVFSGFGNDSSTIKSDFLVNNFVWGLDNCVHAGASGIGGTITSSEGKSSDAIALGRDDFSFDPRALTLSPQAGSAQSGLTFDNRGRKFFCNFTHPLRQAIFEPYYFNRNPYFAPAQDVVDVVSPSAPLFRMTTVISGAVPNARVPGRTAAGAIQSSTLFTRARGCVIYRGNAFPSNFVGNAFIADADAHCIHHVLLRDNGLVPAASRAPEEQGTEFLFSTDPSFRPVQIVNAPDGVLYIADFRDGGETGRILRIVPENFKQPKLPQLGKAKSYDLAATLAHVNGWHRDTAARLLCERKDPAAIGLLTNMVKNARNPLARLNALATLESLGGLNEATVLKALHDTDPAVRERAVLLSEKLTADGLISEPLWNQVRFMADDNFPSVRYQLALTLGQFRHQGRLQLLAQMIRRALDDSFMQTAIFSSLGEGAGECFLTLADDGSTRNSAAGLDLLRRLALMIGTQGSLDDVDRVVDWLDRNSSDPKQVNTYVIAAGLGEGLRRTGSSLALVDPKHRLDRIYSQALSMSPDYRVAEPLRLEAIRLLGASSYSLTDVGDWFLLLLDANQSPAIQTAAINTLSTYSDPRIVTNLMARWPAFTPTLRKQVVAGFLSRVERLDTVLAALEIGRIQAEDLSSTEINLLRTFHDQSIRQRALHLFGPLTPERPAALESFRSALRLAGDANQGREIYQERCANCHRTADNGHTVGPDLAGLRALGKEKLLSAIIEPSAELRSKNLTYLIETKNGHLRVGLLHRQNSRSVTLITSSDNELVLPRVNIESIQPQPYSLMPDRLEEGLTPKSMADLLEYICPR
jgi:putative membrane-bound dehydrogenase-like protein